MNCAIIFEDGEDGVLEKNGEILIKGEGGQIEKRGGSNKGV